MTPPGRFHRQSRPRATTSRCASVVDGREPPEGALPGYRRSPGAHRGHGDPARLRLPLPGQHQQRRHRRPLGRPGLDPRASSTPLSGGHLTGGRTIAATGTIRPDGTVGDVGGVQQKTVAVERAGATVFFVPDPGARRWPEAMATPAPQGLRGRPRCGQALEDLQRLGGDLGPAPPGPAAGPRRPQRAHRLAGLSLVLTPGRDTHRPGSSRPLTARRRLSAMPEDRGSRSRRRPVSTPTRSPATPSAPPAAGSTRPRCAVFLEHVAREMAAAADREQELRRAVAEAEHRAANPVLDEATLTAALGQETARVLRSAHDAAAELVARAEADATRLRAQAQEEAEQLQRRTEQSAHGPFGRRPRRSPPSCAVAPRRRRRPRLEGAKLEAEALVGPGPGRMPGHGARGPGAAGPGPRRPDPPPPGAAQPDRAAARRARAPGRDDRRRAPRRGPASPTSCSGPRTKPAWRPRRPGGRPRRTSSPRSPTRCTSTMAIDDLAEPGGPGNRRHRQSVEELFARLAGRGGRRRCAGAVTRRRVHRRGGPASTVHAAVRPGGPAGSARSSGAPAGEVGQGRTVRERGAPTAAEGRRRALEERPRHKAERKAPTGPRSAAAPAPSGQAGTGEQASHRRGAVARGSTSRREPRTSRAPTTGTARARPAGGAARRGAHTSRRRPGPAAQARPAGRPERHPRPAAGQGGLGARRPARRGRPRPALCARCRATS